VPTLSIDVEGRIAKFQDSLDTLSRDVTRQVRGMERAFGALGKTFGGLGAALGVGALGSVIGQTVSGLAALDDAAEQTGASVESLSSLLNTLRPTGATLQNIVDISGLLTRSMTGADKETSKAAAAFKALGIETRDSAGNLRSVDTVLVDLAEALSQYDDGANKVALAQAALGRAGAQYLPLLKDLATRQREAGTATGEQAAKAEELANQWRTLRAESARLAQQLGGPLVIAVTEVITAFNEARRAGLSFFDSLQAATLSDSKLQVEIDRQKQRIAEARLALEVEKKLRQSTPRMQDDGTLRSIEADIARREVALRTLEARLARIDSAVADGEMNGQRRGRTGRDAPALPTGNDDDERKRRAQQISDGERLLRNLQDQVFTTLQLSQVQRLQADIARGRIQFDNEAQRASALAAAEQIDSIKRIADAAEQESAAALRRIRNYEQLEQAQGAANEAAERSIRAQIEAWEDLADPTRAYIRELDAINERLQQAFITEEQAQRFRASATERLLGAFDDQKAGADKVNAAARDLGFTFQSAFEDAIIEGRRLQDVLTGLARDVARIFLRQTITGPLAESISGFASGLFGGAEKGLGASPFSSVATKAVPAVSAAPASLSFDLSNSALTKDFIGGVVSQAVASARADRVETTFRGKGF
jgi:hypothetical protein